MQRYKPTVGRPYPQLETNDQIFPNSSFLNISIPFFALKRLSCTSSSPTAAHLNLRSLVLPSLHLSLTVPLYTALHHFVSSVLLLLVTSSRPHIPFQSFIVSVTACLPVAGRNLLDAWAQLLCTRNPFRAWYSNSFISQYVLCLVLLHQKLNQTNLFNPIAAPNHESY